MLPNDFPDWTITYALVPIIGPAEPFAGGTVQALIQGTRFRADCECGRAKLIVLTDNFFAGWEQVCEQMCAHHCGEL